MFTAAVQPGFDAHCVGCDRDVKRRRGPLCPIDPLYCDRHGPHVCFNEDSWSGGVVLE